MLTNNKMPALRELQKVCMQLSMTKENGLLSLLQLPRLTYGLCWHRRLGFYTGLCNAFTKDGPAWARVIPSTNTLFKPVIPRGGALVVRGAASTAVGYPGFKSWLGHLLAGTGWVTYPLRCLCFPRYKKDNSKYLPVRIFINQEGQPPKT